MSRKKIGIITSLVGLTVVLVSIFAFHIIEHFQIAITNEKYGGTKSSDIIWLQIDDNWASEENVTEWKLKGYDIVNNETAKNIVIEMKEKENSEITKQLNDQLYQEYMKEYNMTKYDVDRSFMLTGEIQIPYSYYYTSTSGEHCLYLDSGDFNKPMEGRSVNCNYPDKAIIETVLSKVVSLEFNKEYYAQGMNRIQELIGQGYSHPSMTEVPGTTWDNKPTSKYIVVLERPN